jgi:hypothetical protein
MTGQDSKSSPGWSTGGVDDEKMASLERMIHRRDVIGVCFAFVVAAGLFLETWLEERGFPQDPVWAILLPAVAKSMIFAGVAFEASAHRISMSLSKKLNALQQREIESIKNKNLKLQLQLRPRTLTPEQEKALEEFALQIGPQALDIISVTNDMEVGGFSFLVHTVLKTGGWEVKTWTGGQWSAAGIYIGTKVGAPAEIVKVAEALRDAMNSVELDSKPVEVYTNNFGNEKPDGAIVPNDWDINRVANIRVFIGEKRHLLGLPASPE